MKRRLALGCALLVAAASAMPAQALMFDFAPLSGDTLTADQAAAFAAAASVWSSDLGDPITVSISVGFRSLGATILGATSPNYLVANTGTVVAALARDANGAIAAGTYDLVGIAEHEIGHLLGFDSAVDYPGGTPQTLLDQFRYTTSGTRGFTAGQGAYFSIDGGVTSLAAFSVGGTGNDQASHWLGGTRGVMVPEVAAGQTQNIGSLDIAALDAIGYDVATAVPEPSALCLLVIGLAAVAAVRRRTAIPPG